MHNFKENERNFSYINDTLNSSINEEDIRSCIKLLKNNKAASSDKIKNEMIRHSIDSMCFVYKKLFNIILMSGIFPYCVGSFTPIFKVGMFLIQITTDVYVYRAVFEYFSL